MGVVHRDLKPENFLLSSKEENAMLKATDFGLSVFIEEGKVYRDIVGSAYYVAPEVLRRSYGKEIDIWSAGVILYILLSGHYSDRAAAGIIRSIVNVVQICHFMGVVHRDLKPENFLLSSKEENAMLKATDFGLSVFIEEGKVYRDIVGSAYYVAPEVLRGSYVKEIDIWSAGVILYILLSGLPPFWAENEKGIFDEVIKGEIDFESQPWPSISESAKDLFRKMLTKDPRRRITAAQVLEHPWIKGGEAPDKPIDSAVLSRMKQFRAMNKLIKLALKFAGYRRESIRRRDQRS
ncbi:hypothetical protein CARUB_v10001611mg [Capsella rubella]|uniref:Protein kinase domain-containing protein n=1 Tax=Capsella rubella TaxID=81985 RepID=R0FH00_9BRAS|nr:hypothetical protein CARUB_v10001611mg [Capsella rubella]